MLSQNLKTGDWMKINEAEVASFAVIGEALEKEQIDELLMKPALKKLLMYIPLKNEGTGFLAVTSIREPKSICRNYSSELSEYEKEKLNSLTSAVVFQTLYMPDNDRWKQFFYSFYWPGDDNNLEGFFDYSFYMEKDLQQMVFDKAEELIFTFFGVQHLLLNDRNCFKRHEQCAGRTSFSHQLELTAPYTKARKVTVVELTETAQKSIHEKANKMAEYVRHCPAWGVRGHYRHLCSGKVVYVKPYIKGRNKAAYVGREYEILKEK